MDFFTTDYVAFFTIVALGLALGSIKIKGLSLDISAIIFVAMAFGHYGVELPPMFQDVGLILFMFSIGIQAGPGFFRTFKSSGLRLVALASIILVSTVFITLILSHLFKIDGKMTAGLFTGALTSASGLAAATELSDSPQVAIGFGLTYPFGIISIILFARLSHLLFKVNIPEEEEKYKKSLLSKHPALIYRNFIVENSNVIGKTLKELNIRNITHTNISKILRNDIAITATSDTHLEFNDIIRASGTKKNLDTLSYLIGPETDQAIPESRKYIAQSFLLSNRKSIGKTIGEFHELNQFHITITSILRSGIDILPNAGTHLRFGDIVNLTAPVEYMDDIGKLLGNSRDELDEIDFLPIAVGVIFGVFLGRIQIPLGSNIEFSLGLTGGVLIAALILSKIGKTGSIVWNISGTTNQFLRKLGLIFFLAYIGTEAGRTLAASMDETSFILILVGALISLAPIIIAVILGKYVLKMNYLSLLGIITGSITSTPALSAVEPLTTTNTPQEAYAAVYPFSLILIIIASQILVAL